MLPPAADGMKHRDSQQDIRQRVRNRGILSSTLDVSIRSLPLGLRKPCESQGRKYIGVRRDREQQEDKDL